MQPFRLGRWGSSILPLGTKQCSPLQRCHQGHSIRFQSTTGVQATKVAPTAKRPRGRPRKEGTLDRPLRSGKSKSSSIPSSSTPTPSQGPDSIPSSPAPDPIHGVGEGDHIESTNTQSRKSPHRTSVNSSIPSSKLTTLPSPPPANAKSSAKLAALHARLALPSQLPIETLARCLVDQSADPDTRFSNHYLSNLGNDLLGYYLGEHLVCHYPRLPMVVLEAALHAHLGPKALESLARSWGIEVAAEPGGEVDPGLLQFRRTFPLKRDSSIAKSLLQNAQERTGSFTPVHRTLEIASSYFVRSVVASVYLHGGSEKVKEFIRAHFLSRHLDLQSLFSFREPTRDLSRLCAREGFESPIARVISETGRLSRHPVYVVGVFSGRDKIGEDAGASLNEARFKAAAKALKGWYLYSPKTALGGGEIMVPSMMEGEAGKARTWRKPHIDDGEVVA